MKMAFILRCQDSLKQEKKTNICGKSKDGFGNNTHFPLIYKQFP